jgi:hypothetical protein
MRSMESSQSSNRRQREAKARMRYEPTLVYHLAEHAKSRGVDLSQAEGPWRVDVRVVQRPGRTSLNSIPVVTNESAGVMVDTEERAADVAGLLNWCGVHDLDPIPDLSAPEGAAH